jgi:glutamine synthetase
MQREQIVFVGTSDLSGHFRGKSFPLADLEARLKRGVGLAPTNIYMSAFGPIQTTSFGTVGEVFLVPDPTTRAVVPFEGSTTEDFFIGDITTADGAPWDFCPRQALRTALAAVQSQLGWRVLASFEQEFTYSAANSQGWQPYALESYRRLGPYGEALLSALRQAGVMPDSLLTEYGLAQYEVTCAPAVGLRAADDAVITRQLADAVACRLGHRVSFCPIPTPEGTGSGTHIHFSFLDEQDRPVLYDEQDPWGLAPPGRAFIAGIQAHLPALCAITAPSVASYYRLRPNRWAPVRADVAPLDRGAALRICPLSGADPQERARQFNVEFRVADATASPYLALAALLQAGLDGVRRGSPIETHQPPLLPDSLSRALDRLEENEVARDWLGESLLAGYLKFKRAEVEGLKGLDEAEICRRYALAY